MKSCIYLMSLSLLYTSCQKGATTDGPVSAEKVMNNATAAAITAPQRVTSVYIPDSLTFAGEPIPIHRADVREGLEYELMVNTFRHSHTLTAIKNLERWKPLVSQILKESAIPEDFIYLAVIESEFNNNACSYAGAMGMWQLMEETGKEFKLQINDDVDMRRDPKLSTEVACKFLSRAYASLNNWVLTAASYNVGIKGMKNRLEDQKADNFFDLHLNSETGRYVYRILAMKLILENPQAYGFYVEAHEKYAPYKFTTVTVTETINNLVDFAKQYNATYKELRLLNPWFNNTSNFRLKVDKNKVFEIRVPAR